MNISILTQYQLDLIDDIKKKFCSMCYQEKNCLKPCVTVVEYMEKRRGW